MKRALVAGALGVIGRGLVSEIGRTPGWSPLALSRRNAAAELNVESVAVDLLDAESCLAKLSGHSDITHVFYVAYAARPTPAEEVGPNLEMLRNLVQTLEKTAPNLRHITLMQGTKAYGAHIGPYKTPARETDPRIIAPLFYFPQEDFLKEAAAGKAWRWSILRPRCLWGFSHNSPMNMITALAVYCVLSKRLGLPLCFPGTPGGYRRIEQAVDTSLLARVCLWAAEEARCAGETFNVGNGGLFRWEHMWPRIAVMCGMECGPIRTVKLTDAMADKAPLWESLVDDHHLVPIKYRELVDWSFADFQWHMDYDHLSDTTKLIRYGFTEIVDDEEMFLRLLGHLEAARIIPPLLGDAKRSRVIAERKPHDEPDARGALP